MMAQLRKAFKRTPPAIDPAVAGKAEVGLSESKLYNSNMPKYNPDDLIGRKGDRIYRQMMLDEQVKAVVRFKRDAITARDYQFEMPNLHGESDTSDTNQERVEIYEDMVRQTFGSFVDGMNFVLMAMYNGFSMTEKIVDVFDHKGKPYLGLQQLIPKPFESFLFEVDKYGSIIKTIQKMDNQEQTIDLDRFIYYVQNPEFDRHYGQSDLREAYRSWYSKDVIIRFYNQFLEKFAGGFVVASPSSGAALTPGTPEYNSMIAAMASIQTQSSILLPAGMDLDVTRPSTTDQYEKAIALHDLQIAKALLVPNLLGITPQANSSGGGFAQANTQLEAFLWTLDADATRLQEAMNEQVFGPLNKLNFADGDGPLLKFKPVSETKKLEIIKTWQELVTAGAVEASETDEHYIRELMEFPHKGEPLDLEPEIGLGTAEPSGSNGERGPVKKTGEKRANNVRHGDYSVAFTKAEKRVAFNVIEKKANVIEDEGSIKIESKMADMVAGIAGRITEEKLGTPATGANGISTLDFAPKEKNKVRKEIINTLDQAWALGLQHSKIELGIARKQRFKLNFGRIDQDAAEFLKANGFRMFGNLSDDMKAIVQATLINGLKFSWTTDEIVRHMYDSLTAAGFVTLAANAQATARTLEAISESIAEATGGAHRIQTAVRTNVFDAINEARFSTFTDPELDGFVEALEYSAILDSRTTAICRHMDGRVYPIDSPVWNKYRPLNHFNCRSILVPVTIIDDDVTGKDNTAGSRFSRPPTLQPQTGFGGST
jgi:SPP1 gp7 family putative phage head morphogenesis protein